MVPPEIVTLILESFRVLPKHENSFFPLTRDHLFLDADKRDALFNVGLTNKEFSRIALPILWRNLPGISPLLKTIANIQPAEEYSGPYSHREEAWITSEPLEPDSVKRFDFYPAMVRHIDLEIDPLQSGLETVYPTYLSDLLSLRGERPLLPKLQSLIISSACNYPHVFLAPFLQRLEVRDTLLDPQRCSRTTYSPSLSLWRMLGRLGERSAYLEELAIEPAVPLYLVTAFAGLKRLRRLSCNFSAHGLVQGITELSSAQTLEELNLHEDPNDFKTSASAFRPSTDIDQSKVLPTVPFKAVTMTGLETHATDILKLLPGAHLAAFRLFSAKNPADVRFDSAYEEDFWDARYEQATARSQHCKEHGLPDDSGLDVLDASDGFDYTPYPHWTATNTSHRATFLSLVAEKHGVCLTTLVITNWSKMESGWLRPLLQIKGMRHCDFEYATCSGLTDEVMEDIASSWKDLEFFRLYSETSIAVSLAALRSFARHCPELHTLCVDRRVQEMDDTNVASWKALEKLTVFSVSAASHSCKERRQLVVECLRFVLPQLIFAYVELRAHEDSGMDEWRAIFDIVVGRLEMITWDTLYEGTKVHR